MFAHYTCNQARTGLGTLIDTEHTNTFESTYSWAIGMTNFSWNMWGGWIKESWLHNGVGERMTVWHYRSSRRERDGEDARKRCYRSIGIEGEGCRRGVGETRLSVESSCYQCFWPPLILCWFFGYWLSLLNYDLVSDLHRPFSGTHTHCINDNGIRMYLT